MMRSNIYKTLFGFGISLGLSGTFANAETTADGALAIAGAVRVDIASQMSYSKPPRHTYKWRHVRARPNAAADKSLQNQVSVSSFKWQESFNGQDGAAHNSFANSEVVSSSVFQTGYRWGIKSDADQTGYRWGIKSDADQTGYRWGIKSDADQTGYRWGIKSDADQSGYRWGIK